MPCNAHTDEASRLTLRRQWIENYGIEGNISALLDRAIRERRLDEIANEPSRPLIGGFKLVGPGGRFGLLPDRGTTAPPSGSVKTVSPQQKTQF